MAELTITFDTNNAEDLKLLKALPLFTSAATAAPENTSEEKQPKKTAKKQDKKEKAKAAEEQEAAPEEEAAEEQEAEDTDHDISIEEIRELVSEKAKGGHRKDIKAKFEEFDVKNVTTLPEEKYPEFKEFLESLK
jgi:hypothetical protein